MSPKKSGVFAFMVLTQLVAADPNAIAHERPAPRAQAFEVGVASGAFLPAVGPDTMQPDAELGLSVILRLAYLPWSFLGAEAEALHVASRLGARDVGGYAFRGHLVGQIPNRLTPFILAGGGVLGRPTIGDPVAEPSIHWGGGLRWFTHENISLRLEARHLFAWSRQNLRQDLEITVGLSFTLFSEASNATFAVRPQNERSLAAVRE